MYAVISLLTEKFGLVFLLLSLALSIVLPVDIWHFCFLWPFFILGTIMMRTDFLNRLIMLFRKYNCFIGILLGVVLFGYSQFYKTGHTFYNASNYILALGVSGIWWQILFIAFRYIIYGITTVSFLCIFLILYETLRNKIICKIILFIGRRTFGIFVIHILGLYHIFKPFVEKYTMGAGLLPSMPAVRYYVAAVFISAAAIAFSLLSIKLIEKTKLTNYLLLGR